MLDELLVYQTGIPLAKARLLIAEPQMQDTSFQKTVILLCHHNTQESMGFILNRPMAHPLGYYIAELQAYPFPVYEGGPVGRNTLHLIHTCEALGGELLEEGIYWGGDHEAAFRMIQEGQLQPHQCRFFIGYAGWGEGQLDAEMDMRSWLVAPMKEDLVFGQQTDEAWRLAIKALGRKFNPLLYVPLKSEYN